MSGDPYVDRSGRLSWDDTGALGYDPERADSVEHIMRGGGFIPMEGEPDAEGRPTRRGWVRLPSSPDGE